MLIAQSLAESLPLFLYLLPGGVVSADQQVADHSVLLVA